MNDKVFQRILLIIQIATVCLFIGRAWQHLFWDAPFRSLLWDEGWMSRIVDGLFNISWDEYITSAAYDAKIQSIIKIHGWFYLICALMAVFIKKWKQVASVFMIIGSISLFFLAGLYCKEKFFSVGQFFEYSIQFSTPIVLFILVKKERFTSNLILFLKIIIALTFVCHGLYAVNYYPRPGLFLDMTINILGLSETNAEYFLLGAGLLDFIIGIGIFLPFKYSKYVLIYAFFWGFLTTISRIWAHAYFDFLFDSLNQWWFEAAYRVPHFMIPLAFYLFYKNTAIESRKRSI